MSQEEENNITPLPVKSPPSRSGGNGGGGGILERLAVLENEIRHLAKSSDIERLESKFDSIRWIIQIAAVLIGLLVAVLSLVIGFMT